MALLGRMNESIEKDVGTQVKEGYGNRVDLLPVLKSGGFLEQY